MTFRSEIPPPPGNLRRAEPPASDRTATAKLRTGIDGAAGDNGKVPCPCPSHLGTDAEAADRAPSPGRIAMARATEPARVWAASRPRGPNGWIVPGGHATIGGVGTALAITVEFV